MQTLPASKGFLGITEKPTDDKSKPKVVVIPFGVEKSVSYGGGTAAGPEAMISASHEVELFDEELWEEPFRKFRLTTLKKFPIEKKLSAAITQLEKIVGEVLEQNQFPLIFGGEHSLTPGVVNAITKKFGEISILHFDAHADLRDGYLGEKFSHAAAMQRCLDNPKVKKLVSVGIRNLSEAEAKFIPTQKHRLKIFWAHEKKDWKTKEIVHALGKHPVYISFDLDAFDSSLMPATGTPEPGGLFWHETLTILRAVSKKKKIIGVDIVELAPKKNLEACDFLAAKLAYKILSYIRW
ncbi:MAG: agmatinase [Candidatus Gracilibacteria bacterium]|jgi:agmatinase